VAGHAELRCFAPDHCSTLHGQGKRESAARLFGFPSRLTGRSRKWKSSKGILTSRCDFVLCDSGIPGYEGSVGVMVAEPLHMVITTSPVLINTTYSANAVR
jgi:hypothetical protein